MSVRQMIVTMPLAAVWLASKSSRHYIFYPPYAPLGVWTVCVVWPVRCVCVEAVVTPQPDGLQSAGRHTQLWRGRPAAAAEGVGPRRQSGDGRVLSRQQQWRAWLVRQCISARQSAPTADQPDRLVHCQARLVSRIICDQVGWTWVAADAAVK